MELTGKKKPLGSTSSRGRKGLVCELRSSLPLYAEVVKARPGPLPLAQLRSRLPREVSWLVVHCRTGTFPPAYAGSGNITGQLPTHSGATAADLRRRPC